MAAPDTDTEAIKAHILDIIKSMEDEGMVDFNFAMVHGLKEIAGPFFFASVVPKFCHDSTTTFRSLTVALSQPDPNYYDIGELCFKIKGSASSIGACRMSLACRELLQAVLNKEAKESCVTKLNAAKQEFFTLQDKIDSLVQGMVDFNFATVHRLKEIAGPFFFASVVPTFCHDSTATFRSLTVALSQPDPNYYEIGELCFKIKGSASSIGACRMSLACRELLRAVQNKEAKESCVTKLNAAKQEFFTLQDKMDSLVQLERRIVCTETDGP